jgi:hypothetical protein
MPRTRRRPHPATALWIACLLPLLAPRPARAISKPPLPTEASVEWAVEAADRVVRGTVRPGMVRPVRVGNVTFHEVTLDVTETLRGPATEQVAFVAPEHLGLDRSPDSWTDLLVFLQPTTPAARANAASVDLSAWAVWNSWAFDLGRPSPAKYRMDGMIVDTAEPLLNATREAARFTAGRAGPAPYYVLPRGLPPGDFRRLYANRAEALIVPSDARLESLAQRWLTDRDDSIRAAAPSAIAPFKTPHNIALLRRLLDDPAYIVHVQNTWTPDPARRELRFHPVRSAAAAQLMNWGDDAGATAAVHVPHPQYAPLPWRPAALATAAALLALALWPRRLHGPAWGTILTLASLAACAATILLNHRAARSEDTLTLAAAGANWELASTVNRLTLLRVQDGAPPHGLLHRSYPTASPQPWFATMLTPRDETRRAGFHFAEGVTTGAARHPYRLLELHHGWLVGATLAWPAAWLVGQTRRAARRRRWRREGRCARCGYSLHGLTSPRCPECGAPTHALTAEVE